VCWKNPFQNELHTTFSALEYHNRQKIKKKLQKITLQKKNTTRSIDRSAMPWQYASWIICKKKSHLFLIVPTQQMFFHFACILLRNWKNELRRGFRFGRSSHNHRFLEGIHSITCTIALSTLVKSSAEMKKQCGNKKAVRK